MLRGASEVAFASDRAIVFPSTLIKLNTEPIPSPEIHTSNKSHDSFDPSFVFDLYEYPIIYAVHRVTAGFGATGSTPLPGHRPGASVCPHGRGGRGVLYIVASDMVHSALGGCLARGRRVHGTAIDERLLRAAR